MGGVIVLVFVWGFKGGSFFLVSLRLIRRLVSLIGRRLRAKKIPRRSGGRWWRLRDGEIPVTG